MYPVINQNFLNTSLDEVLNKFTDPFTLIKALMDEGQSVELNMTTNNFRMPHEHMLKRTLTISQAVNLGDQNDVREIDIMRQEKLRPQTIFNHRKRAYEDWHAELQYKIVSWIATEIDYRNFEHCVNYLRNKHSQFQDAARFDSSNSQGKRKTFAHTPTTFRSSTSLGHTARNTGSSQSRCEEAEFGRRRYNGRFNCTHRASLRRVIIFNRSQRHTNFDFWRTSPDWHRSPREHH